MKIIGFIYLTTNLVNGKVYVGQHIVKSPKDFNDGYLGSGTLFQRSLRKYGKDNFKRKILKVCYSLNQLNAFETYYIKKYNPNLDPNVGYNQCPGPIDVCGRLNPAKLPEVREKIRKGTKEYWKDNFEAKNKVSIRRKGKKASKETREKLSKSHIGIKRNETWLKKLSESNSGKNHWAWGKTFTEEHRRNLSKGIKGKMAGEKHPLYGKKMSEESRRKMSEKQKIRWENIRKNKQLL